jgi:hypothetical protein
MENGKLLLCIGREANSANQGSTAGSCKAIPDLRVTDGPNDRFASEISLQP